MSRQMTDTLPASQCDIRGCTAPAVWEGWLRNVTGAVVELCDNHRALIRDRGTSWRRLR